MLKTSGKQFSLSSLQTPSSDFEDCSKLPCPEKKAREGEEEEQMCRKVGPRGVFRIHLNSFSVADEGKLCRFLSGLLSLSGEGMSSKEN